jgi:hypothetical protein
MAIGAANHPDLTWRFVSGGYHTIPVGYDKDGKPRVVMDILLFDQITAQQSITLAETRRQPAGPNWDSSFRWFEEHVVAAVRTSVQYPIGCKNESREAAQIRAMRILRAAIRRSAKEIGINE